MTEENTAQVDNTASQEDNANEVIAGADLSGSEEATAYREIISAKDEIIGAYESQVKSLKEQIARLVRNGASIDDGTPRQQTQGTPNLQQSNLGGFGRGADAYEELGLKSLGREIGKRG